MNTTKLRYFNHLTLALLLITLTFISFYTFGQSTDNFSIPDAQKIKLLEDNKTLLVSTNTSTSFFSWPNKKFLKQIPHRSYLGSDYLIDKKDSSLTLIRSGISDLSNNNCCLKITNIITGKEECIIGPSTKLSFIYKNFNGSIWYGIDVNDYLKKIKVGNEEVISEEFVNGLNGKVVKVSKTFTNNIAVMTRNGTLTLLNPDNGEVVNSIKFSDKNFDDNSLSYSDLNLIASPKSNLLITFDKNKYVVWNSETLQKIREYNFTPFMVDYPEKVILKFSNDGQFFAFGQFLNGKIDVYRSLSGIKVKSLKCNKSYLDFEISTGFKSILLLTEDRRILKVGTDFTGEISNSLFWHTLYTNNKYAYVFNYDFDVNQVDLQTSTTVKKNLASYMWGYNLQTSSNPDELIGVSNSGLARFNFKQTPMSKKVTDFKLKHPKEDFITGYNEVSNQALFYYQKSFNIKLFDVNSQLTIDSLKYLPRISIDKVIGSQSSQAFYLFGHKLVMKYQQGAEPEVIIKDTDYKHLKDDFGRNLILVFKENFEIFDLDQNKTIHVLDKSLYSHLREPNYIEISFSSNMKMAIFTHYRNTTKYLVDISKNEIIQSFEDPRILKIKFKTDSDLFLIYNNRIQSTRIN